MLFALYYIFFALLDPSCLNDGDSNGPKLIVTRKGTLNKITLFNASNKPIRIWKPGTMWGDFQFKYIHQREDGRKVVSKRTGIYTPNIPLVQEIGPGKSYILTHDLADGTWTNLGGDNGKLVAVVLSIDIDDQSLSDGCILERIVWLSSEEGAIR